MIDLVLLIIGILLTGFGMVLIGSIVITLLIYIFIAIPYKLIMYVFSN